jgi:hypothetical protein
MTTPKGRAADWTEEQVSEERAIERRGKLGGFQRPGGAKQTEHSQQLRSGEQ